MVSPEPDESAPSGLQLDLLASVLRLRTALADVELLDEFLGRAQVRDLIGSAIMRLEPHLSPATRAWATARGFLWGTRANDVADLVQDRRGQAGGNPGN